MLRKTHIALALVFLCAFISVSLQTGLAEGTSRTFDHYDYVILDDATVEITGWHGEDTALTIPETLDGMTVSSIGPKAFAECRNLTAVTLPDSIDSIETAAFRSCWALTDVNLARVSSIGPSAFSDCISLTSVVIPDSVISIGDYAFGRCERLEHVTISDSVTEIGANPFFFCEQLVDITLSPAHPALRIVDNVLFTKDDGRLIYAPMDFPNENADNTYEIPDSISVIGPRAFCACYGISHIIIPQGVTAIENEAFLGCNMSAVTISSGVLTIGDFAFCQCPNLTTVSIPESVEFIGRDAFSICAELTLAVPEGSYAEQYAIDNNLMYTAFSSTAGV